MKYIPTYLLQKLLGFHNYLFVYSLFKIYVLRWDRKENDFMFFLKLIPKRKGIVLDIGANIGFMTVHLARKSKDLKVYSFEPIPYNLHVLKKIVNLFRLQNVKIIDCALGNENKEIEMVMPVIHSIKMQGLSHVVHDSILKNNEGEKFKVINRRLDDIDEIKNITHPVVVAIKIDVEKFEYFVLDGGKELLKKYKPIVYCEVSRKENGIKCFQLMKDLGYEIKVLEKGKLNLYNHQKPINFFFIPSEDSTAKLT